ncbi:MAG TPA: ammonia-forming cytochrome c nitrite reductase subunit c552 [Dissulfurispiraceae bacterium]|nr:ammonia-forming cytochrome c nitrite reductase subunit c552 [Dissulfurispiraceae bacterium]
MIKVVVVLICLTSLLSAGTAAFSASAAKKLPVATTQQPALVDAVKDATYVGSQTCKKCHSRQHAEWSQTWHANMHRVISPDMVVADFDSKEITYKDIEIADSAGAKVKISPTVGVHREGDKFLMTLLDKDNAANNQTYEMTYVLGGNWNQHFEAKIGNRLYATPMRWEVADMQWFNKQFNDFWWVVDGTADGRPKKPSEMPINQVGDAKCDSCHTTGFKTAKDKTSGEWIAQKSELGISCEVCHGPGSKHAQRGSKAAVVNPLNLSAAQQDQLCGQCHSRVTNKHIKDISFPQDFFIGNTDLQDRVTVWTFQSNPESFWPNGDAKRNRQQYQDIQKSGHAKGGVTCITCHDVHSSKKGYGQVRGSKQELCASCHTQSADFYRGSAMAKAGTTCADCHMAKIATRSGATKKAKDHWDASAHTMKVYLPQAAAASKMKSSCDACHTEGALDKKGTELLSKQSAVKAKIDEVKTALAEYEKKGKNARKARKAQSLLDAVLTDGSGGAHNPDRAMALLTDALKQAK